MKNGTLKKIKIFSQKGQPPSEADFAHCAVDLGLLGDRFAKGGTKQLTVVDTVCTEWMKDRKTKGLCFEKFKANLTVEGIDISALKSGDILTLGEVELAVSDSGKECFSQCERVCEKKDCMLRTHAKYLVVKNGGEIKTGCEIYIK